MKEVSRKRIMANSVVQVGLVKVLQRDGDGGQFHKAVLWDNFETVLEDAAKLGQREIRLEIVE